MNRMVSIEKIKEFLLIILMLFITVYLFCINSITHRKTINEANNEANNEASKSKKSTVANPTKG